MTRNRYTYPASAPHDGLVDLPIAGVDEGRIVSVRPSAVAAVLDKPLEGYADLWLNDGRTLTVHEGRERIVRALIEAEATR